ncbi:MAG: response regulator [Vulcanimicrobiota bacterium]
MVYSILVVEDDPNMQQLIVEFLEEEGFHARGAGSSEEALKLAGRFDFDLVVTDVRMAGVDGVDGFVLLKKLRPELKCIVITGYADETATARAVQIQVDDYLYKPFKLDDLLEAVDRVRNSGTRVVHYYELLEKLPGKLLSAARRLFQRDKPAALDEVRLRVFKGYYVAIRSNLVSVNSANGVFVRLLDLDQEYREYLSSSQDASEAQTLQGQYDELFQFLTALARSKAQMLGGERLPAAEFRPIYNAVQKGTITSEQLQLAPTLKLVNPEELVSSPELRELREKLWG